MISKDTFEATYPHYPFAPLVRAGVAIAAWLSAREMFRGTGASSGGAAGNALGSAA